MFINSIKYLSQIPINAMLIRIIRVEMSTYVIFRVLVREKNSIFQKFDAEKEYFSLLIYF